MKKSAICVIAVLVLTLFFIGCDDFFSTPLGGEFGFTARTYDPDKIDVNNGNLDVWLKQSSGNMNLSYASFKSIAAKVKDPTKIDQNALLIAGGAKLAVESTGLGQSILSNAGSTITDLISEEINNPEELLGNILTNILNDFNSNKGVEKAKEMAEMLKGSGAITINSNTPNLATTFIDELDAGDVSNVLLVLLVSVVADSIYANDPTDALNNNIESILSGLDFSSGSGNIKINSSPSPSTTAIVLAAYVNAGVTNSKFSDDLLIGVLKDLF